MEFNGLNHWCCPTDGKPGPSENGASATGEATNGGKICVVCDEPASGLYFGALVCLPCKSFYIRCTKDTPNPIFTCVATPPCIINKATRLRCQRCRYDKCIAAGMCRREKPEVIEPTDGQDSCKVCGDIANGIHFGIHTCEGCKKFFRRGLREAEMYECKLGNSCKITPRSRNGCRKCRYNKCLRVGMSREAIRMGRPKKHPSRQGNSRLSSGQVQPDIHLRNDELDIHPQNDQPDKMWPNNATIPKSEDLRRSCDAKPGPHFEMTNVGEKNYMYEPFPNVEPNTKTANPQSVQSFAAAPQVQSSSQCDQHHALNEALHDPVNVIDEFIEDSDDFLKNLADRENEFTLVPKENINTLLESISEYRQIQHPKTDGNHVENGLPPQQTNPTNSRSQTTIHNELSDFLESMDHQIWGQESGDMGDASRSAPVATTANVKPAEHSSNGHEYTFSTLNNQYQGYNYQNNASETLMKNAPQKPNDAYPTNGYTNGQQSAIGAFSGDHGGYGGGNDYEKTSTDFLSNTAWTDTQREALSTTEKSVPGNVQAEKFSVSFCPEYWDVDENMEVDSPNQSHQELMTGLQRGYEFMVDESDEGKLSRPKVDHVPGEPLWKTKVKKRIINNIRATISYANMIPGFVTLIKADQFYLCRYGGFQMMIVLASREFYNVKLGKFNYFFEESLAKGHPGYLLQQSLFENGRILNSMKLDIREAASLGALSIVSADWDANIDKKSIDAISESVREAFFSYVIDKHGHKLGMSRIEELMAMMVVLRRLAIWHAEYSKVLKFEFCEDDLISMFSNVRVSDNNQA